MDTSSWIGCARELPDDQVPGVALFLQYGVREGREASELGGSIQAFIANCNVSFILQLGG